MKLKEFVVRHVLCSYPEDVIDRLIDYLDHHLDLIRQVYDKTTRRRHLVQFLVDVLQFHDKQNNSLETIDFIVIALVQHGIYARRVKTQREQEDQKRDNDKKQEEEENTFMIQPNGMVRLGSIEVALGWCFWQNENGKEQPATSATTKHSNYCHLVQEEPQDDDIWHAVSGLYHLRHSPPAMTTIYMTFVTTSSTPSTTSTDVNDDVFDHQFYRP